MHKQNLIIYNTFDGKASVALYAKDGMVWMNQNQIAELFDTSVQNTSMHIVNILKDGKLDRNSVIKDYLTTATDGKNYNVQYYNLDAIISVGYRVNSRQATKSRIWATNTLKEYIIKGFILDDDRLKNGRYFGKDYFRELLECIRKLSICLPNVVSITSPLHYQLA